jgi:hypothetical protein
MTMTAMRILDETPSPRLERGESEGEEMDEDEDEGEGEGEEQRSEKEGAAGKALVAESRGRTGQPAPLRQEALQFIGTGGGVCYIQILFVACCLLL